MSRKEPMFPILGDEIIRCIPWAAIAPHEAQAQRNHSQSLKRLAERGGLDVTEAVLAMRGKPLFFGLLTPQQVAAYRVALMNDIMKFEQSRAAPTEPVATQEPQP